MKIWLAHLSGHKEVHKSQVKKENGLVQTVFSTVPSVRHDLGRGRDGEAPSFWSRTVTDS